MSKLPITAICFSYTRAISYYKETLDFLKKRNTFSVFDKKIISCKVLDNKEDTANEIIGNFLQEGFIGYKRYLSTNPQNTLEYQNEYLLDMIAASKEDLGDNEYVFIFENDSPFEALNGNTLESLFKKAIYNFEKSDFGRIGTLQYRFLRNTNDINLPRNNDFMVEKDFNFQPFLMKKDHYIHCCRVLEANWSQLKNLQCEMAFRYAADTLSNFAYRFKVFLPEEGMAYHLDGNKI